MSHLNINGVDKPLDHVYVKARTENLFDKDNIVSGGDWYITTKVIASVNCDMFVLPCKPNTSYTVSRQVILHRFTVGFVDSFPLYKDQVVSGSVAAASEYSITTTSAADSAYIVVYYAKHAGSDSNTAEEIQQCLDTMMVVEGSETPSQYVPYYITKEAWEAKSRVILRGLTNPLCGIDTYKDTLDLSTGPLTRYVKKLVLTGEETMYSVMQNTAQNAYCFGYKYADLGMSDIINYNEYVNTIPYPEYISSHFRMRTIPTSQVMYYDLAPGEMGANSWARTQVGWRNGYLIFCTDFCSTEAEFKQYLASEYSAGHPVTIWYILATPVTEQITLPSNLTGIVEGYLTQSGTTTPTNPIYPTANGTLEQGGTYSLDTGAYAITWGRADTFTGTNSISARCYGLPVKSWEIDGNSQQSGVPSPDNIIMPEFVGERTENVMPASPAGVHEENGLTFTSDGNGIYTVSGIASETTLYMFRLNSTFTIPIASGRGGHGTFSLFNSQAPSTAGAPCRAQFFLGDTQQDSWALNTINRRSINYENMGGLKCDGFGLYISAGVEIDMQISPVLTDNDTYPDSYIPYGYKISLTSAGQTVPVYLGQVSAVRQINKKIFTGDPTEDWHLYNGVLYSADISDYLRIKAVTTICSHYPSAENASGVAYVPEKTICMGTESNDRTFIRDSDFSSASNFRAFLAEQYQSGTPLTFWYVLETPQTGIVNEPLCKIDTYADTLSSEQAGVILPTNDGNTTISVDTALAPSKFEVKVHAKPIHYGFKIDKSISDPSNAVIYTHDAVTMTPAGMDFTNGVFDYGSWENVWFIKNARPVMLNFDGTEAYDLDPNDYSKKLDGTPSDIADSTKNMNAMIAFPTVWIKRTDDGSYNYIEISDRQLDSDFHAYAHEDANGIVKPYIYLPIYKGSMVDGKLRSISGVKPQSGTTAQQEVDAASALGTGWQIWDYTSKEMLCDLLTLISKSLDTQGKFGQG